MWQNSPEFWKGMCQNTHAAQHNALQSTHCRNIRTRTRTLGSPPTVTAQLMASKALQEQYPCGTWKLWLTCPTADICNSLGQLCFLGNVSAGCGPSLHMGAKWNIWLVWEGRKKTGFHFVSTKGNQNGEVPLILGSCILYKWKLYSTKEGNLCIYQYSKSAFFSPTFLVSVMALTLLCKYV